MEYALIRSKRKTISLEVTKNLDVIVRAPLKMPDADIRRFAESHTGWVNKHLERQRVNYRPEPTAEDIQRLTAMASEMIPGKTAHYAGIMTLYPKGIRITAAKTRFGSCSGKNRLCFSCFLMRYPEEAIDYVVVHELAHIRHKNHQREFWTLVETVMPDYKARRALLRKPPRDMDI